MVEGLDYSDAVVNMAEVCDVMWGFLNSYDLSNLQNVFFFTFFSSEPLRHLFCPLPFTYYFFFCQFSIN